MIACCSASVAAADAVGRAPFRFSCAGASAQPAARNRARSGTGFMARTLSSRFAGSASGAIRARRGRRRMRTIMLLLALAGCTTAPAPPPSNETGTVTARLGEEVRLGTLRIRPVAVLEDSRCPVDVTCVWAGRIRVRVAVSSVGEPVMELNQPVAVPGGSLSLVAVAPPRWHSPPAERRSECAAAVQVQAGWGGYRPTGEANAGSRSAPPCWSRRSRSRRSSRNAWRADRRDAVYDGRISVRRQPAGGGMRS